MASEEPYIDDSLPMYEAVTPENKTPLYITTDSGETDTEPTASELDSIGSQLDTSQSELVESGNEIADSISADMFQPEMDVNTSIAEITGGIDRTLESVTAPVESAIDKISNQTSQIIQQSQYDLQSTGVNFPFNVGVQQQMNEVPPDQWIDAVIPPIIGEVVPTVPTHSVPRNQTTNTSTAQATISGEPTVNTAFINEQGQFCQEVGTPGKTLINCFDGPPPPVEPVDPFIPQPVEQIDECPDVCEENPVVGVALAVTDKCGNVTNYPLGGVVNNTTIQSTVVGTPVPPPTDTPVTIVNVPPVSPPQPPPPQSKPDKQLPPITMQTDCIDWDTLNVCTVGTAGTTPTTPPTTVGTPVGGSGGKTWLDDMLSFASSAFSIVIPGYAPIDAAIKLVAPHGPLELFAVQHDLAAKLTKEIFGSLTGNCSSDIGRTTLLAAQLGAAQWAERITGVPTDYLLQSVRYQFQFTSPQFLPGQADVDNLHLRDKIDYDTWRCLTMANGNLPNWHYSACLAKQQLLTPDQITQLFRRGLIDPRTYGERMAELGFKNDSYVKDTFQLSELPLGASDIIRCMVRDSFDPAVVQKYQYDKDFNDKFTNQAKDWFYWQGYSKDQAQYLWYAHWEIPSYTQLSEMLHRLRPDRQEVAADDAANPLDANGNRPQGAPAPPSVVTLKDVQDALEINDMAPRWVQPLIDISYRPWTNSDAIRAYIIGYLTKKELVGKFQDNGYSKPDASTLADYWEFESNKRLRTQSGVLTPRKVVQMYKDGALDLQTARAALEEIFPNADQLDKLFRNADAEAAAETKQAYAKSLRRKFLAYAIDAKQLGAALRAGGIDGIAADRTVTVWTSERDGKSKEATAAMLCKWHDRGLIAAADVQFRLEQLGYTRIDAQRITAVCAIDSARKKAKEQTAAARQALADTKANLLMKIAELKQEIASLTDRRNQLQGTP
jgi:hypothetical protein